MRYTETESGMVAVRGRGKGTTGELLINRYRVSVMQDGKSSGNWYLNHVKCAVQKLSTYSHG